MFACEWMLISVCMVGVLVMGEKGGVDRQREDLAEASRFLQMTMHAAARLHQRQQKRKEDSKADDDDKNELRHGALYLDDMINSVMESQAALGDDGDKEEQGQIHEHKRPAPASVESAAGEEDNDDVVEATKNAWTGQAALEKAIGARLLPSLVRGFKEVSMLSSPLDQEETDQWRRRNSSGRRSSHGCNSKRRKGKWIPLLRAYKAVHSILIGRGRPMMSIVLLAQSLPPPPNE